MEKEIKKISYKVLPFVLCLCIVSGAAAPAYATTNADTAAQKLFDLYWSTSSNPSGQNSTWYGVVRILLKDIYDRLESVWSDQRNLWTYNSTSYSLWNFSNNSNLSNSYYISNGAGPVSWLLNSMANLSQNTGYTANQFYNSNSNLNKAMSAMVSLNQNFQDYTTVLNNIKSNTDNLLGIKSDTANLSGIKTDTANLSGIKTDTANLSGIKTDTANLSGIKIDTSNLSGIKSDIETFNSDYNNINWVVGGTYYGVLNGSDTSYNTSKFYSKDITFVMSLNKGSAKIYKVILPFTLYNANTYDTSYDVYIYRQSNNQKLERLNIIGVNTSYQTATEFIFTIPDNYNTLQIGINVKSNENGNFIVYGNSSADIYYLNSDTKDYFHVYDNALLFNINKLFNQAKEVFFDDKTIAAKKANQAQEDSVLSNFTGSGAASVSVSDFGAVKDSMVDFKAGFTGGASSSDTFSFLSGDSNAWDWFTQDTANDVDRTQGNNNRLLRSSSFVASDTPLLDSYYTSILSILGGDK